MIITTIIITSITVTTSVIAVCKQWAWCGACRCRSAPTTNHILIQLTITTRVSGAGRPSESMRKVNQRHRGNQVERTEDPSPWSSRLDREGEPMSSSRRQQSYKSCQRAGFRSFSVGQKSVVAPVLWQYEHILTNSIPFQLVLTDQSLYITKCTGIRLRNKERSKKQVTGG